MLSEAQYLARAISKIIGAASARCPCRAKTRYISSGFPTPDINVPNITAAAVGWSCVGGLLVKRYSG